jgi:serine/threonine-protein kinase
MHERWGQIKEILASALDLSPSERDSFILKACGEDEALRAEVASLIAHRGEADAILENSPMPEVFSSSTSSPIGRQMGAYRIVREAGQGGMAVVYEAQRANQEFEKHVAIKMLQPGINSVEIERRFRNERQTLAALDHPHIVKLLGGGATEDGRPYLVMEFVEGLPIDQYCDTRRLSIRERLELFRLVCLPVGRWPPRN